MGLVHIVLFAAVLVAFSKYKEKSLFILTFLILGVFAALRYNYGNDYDSYMFCYEQIRAGINNPFKNEIGYTALNKIMPSFYVLVAVTAIFFILVIYKFIEKNLNGVYRGFAVLIFAINPYLFLMNLSSMRQCIALSIFIISLNCIQERKLIRYLLLIALATIFHTSAILLVPIYFIANNKKINIAQTVALIIVVAVVLLESAIVDSLVKVGLDFFDNANYWYHFTEGTTNSLRATFLTGLYFVYVVINLKNLEGHKLICGKLYLIGLVLGMLAVHYSMFTRIQMYFDVFSVVAVPAIIEYHVENSGNKWEKVINLWIFPIVLLLIYVLRYYSFFTNPMWERFGTYHTIFEMLL